MVRGSLLIAAAGGVLAALLARGMLTRFVVANRSMLPTLLPGDRLLVDQYAYRLGHPRRGDLALFRHPDRPGRTLIKRLVGLSGEQVSLGDRLVIDGQAIPEPYLLPSSRRSAPTNWRLGPNQYVMLGDNRAESRDSRHFGAVEAGQLVGRAWYRYWPPERRGRLGGEHATTRPIH